MYNTKKHLDICGPICISSFLDIDPPHLVNALVVEEDKAGEQLGAELGLDGRLHQRAGHTHGFLQALQHLLAVPLLKGRL